MAKHQIGFFHGYYDEHMYHPLRFIHGRTAADVDIVVAEGGRLIPLVVKLSDTPWPAMAHNLTAFQKDLGERASAGFLVHPGEVRLPLAPRLTALPFSNL